MNPQTTDLVWERNIQIPGSFVILQGIPGDGLLNTINVAPDFQHLSQDGEAPLIQEEETSPIRARTRLLPPPSLASLSPFPQTFLGQGIPSRYLRTTTTTSSSSRSANTTGSSIMVPSSATAAPLQPFRSRSVSRAEAPPPTEDSYVLVEEEQAYDELETESGTTDAINAQEQRQDWMVQQAITIWKEERVTWSTRMAVEWLAAARQHQETCSSRNARAPKIPILLSLTKPQGRPPHRWWLCPRTAQLRVFSTLPCPRPSSHEEKDMDPPSLPPGTTVVALALHTFELETTPGDHSFKYIGQCTYFDGNERIVPEHCPRPGRIQYLHTESPLEGYILFNVDGYSVLSPGLPTSSLFTGMEQPQRKEHQLGRRYAEQHSNQERASCCWWWKVTYHDGAIVRQGLDLNTSQLCILPFGTQVQVLRKVVNAVGLSRLLVRASIVTHDASDSPQQIEGWCSQFLNPMAGQRGAILQPVPMAVPVWFQIRQPCTVRKEIELSSAVVRTFGIIGATVPVLARNFTEFPARNCLPRLQLAPHAFASLHINGPVNIHTDMAQSSGRTSKRTLSWLPRSTESLSPASFILEPTGEIDATFDPATPGLYHWQNHLKWTRPIPPASLSFSSVPLGADLHVAEDPTPPALSSTATTPEISHSPLHTAPTATTTSASATEISSVGGESISSSSSASSESVDTATNTHQPVSSMPQTARLCMCCEDKVANATMIHGQTGHICCCLECARIIQAQKLGCPICRLEIDNVILHFYS